MNVSYLDFTILNHQLATLLNAGIGLPQALKAIAEDMRDKGFRVYLHDLAQDVEGGMPFSQAVEKQPPLFPAYYVPLLQASEQSGTMTEVLHELGDQAQELEQVRKNFAVALIYPLILMMVGVFVGFFLFSFVFPVFKDMSNSIGHADFGQKTLFFLGYYLRFPVLVLLCLVAFLGVMFLYSLHRYHPKVQEVVEKAIIKIPVLNSLYFHFSLIYFIKILQLLLKTRMPLAESMRAAARGANNRLLEQEVDGMAADLEKGTPLKQVIQASLIMPQSLKWLLTSGAETSELERILRDAGELIQLKTDVYRSTVVAVAEPTAVVFVGAMIGLFIISNYLPMLTIVQMIQ